MLIRAGVGGKRAAQGDLIAEMRRYAGDIVDCFVRKFPAGLKVVIQSSWARVIGRQKTGRAIFLVENAQISGPGHDVVVRLIGIATQRKLRLHVRIGFRHELHEPHCAGIGRCGLTVEILMTARLLLDDGPDPLVRD